MVPNQNIFKIGLKKVGLPPNQGLPELGSCL